MIQTRPRHPAPQPPDAACHPPEQLRFKDHIVRTLESADAPVVITLGDEPLQVLKQVPELSPTPPADSLAELYGASYGKRGYLRVNGRRVEWLALAHPGLLKGTPTPVVLDPARRTLPGWNWVHAEWAAIQQQ